MFSPFLPTVVAAQKIVKSTLGTKAKRVFDLRSLLPRSIIREGNTKNSLKVFSWPIKVYSVTDGWRHHKRRTRLHHQTADRDFVLILLFIKVELTTISFRKSYHTQIMWCWQALARGGKYAFQWGFESERPGMYYVLKDIFLALSFFLPILRHFFVWLICQN